LRNYIVLMLAIVLGDWLTKSLVITHIPYGGHVEVLPFLQWVHWHNLGAAFGFLHDSPGWQRWFLMVVAILEVIILSIWLYRTSKPHFLQRIALSCIIAGAVGNLYDRAVFGYVIDFILLFYRGVYFPAFNVADTAITIGVVALLWCMLLESKRERCK